MATLVVNPQSGGGGGNVSCDGYVLRGGVDEAWATILAGAGTGSDVSGVFSEIAYNSSATTNQWAAFVRPILTFDTSALGAGATITAVTLTITGRSKNAGPFTGTAPDINVYGATPANANNLANADYQQFGSTPLCDTPITYAGFNNAGTNVFTLNAAGIAAINKTGVTKLSLRNPNHEVSGSMPGWVSSDGASITFYTADNGSSMPTLTITYILPNSNFLQFF